MDGSGNAFFTTKETLDTFSAKLNSKGKIGFHIAYHAYSQGLVDPEFWDDWETANNTGSKIITMNNIGVLTSYVKKKFGSDCKIMLAEQSFNANHGENVQAATYAYAYYKSECDAMIEVFAYGREFDTEEENNSGIYWGLSDKNHNRRLIWNIFKYIDCNKSLKYTKSLVSCTNLKSWAKISGKLKTKISKFPKRASACGQVETMPFGFAGYGAVQLNWRPVAGCEGYKIYRNGKMIKTVKASSGVTSYVDTGLIEGKTYVYQIRAYKKIAKYNFSGSVKTIYGKYSKKLTWVGI